MMYMCVLYGTWCTCVFCMVHGVHVCSVWYNGVHVCSVWYMVYMCVLYGTWYTCVFYGDMMVYTC